MPSKEDIDRQQQLLASHRDTLSIRLNQQARLGAAHTSPEVIHDIREARDNIQRIKVILRGWGVAVENSPDDEEITLPEQTDKTVNEELKSQIAKVEDTPGEVKVQPSHMVEQVATPPETKEHPMQTPAHPVLRLWHIGIIAVVVALLVIWQGSRHLASNIVLTPISSINLETKKISNGTFEVSWQNLPQENNLYLVIADENRFYNPQPIGNNNSSGKHTITPGSGIKSVAIIQILNNMSISIIPSNGISKLDENIRIMIQKDLNYTSSIQHVPA